jgi:restriction system protein
MPVPDYKTLMLSVLRRVAGGAQNVRECIAPPQRDFDLSDEDVVERLPSGRMTVLQNRVYWARTYLSNAGLLESPHRSLHVVTRRGHELLAGNASSDR